jgi:hypothetical protein
VIVVDIDQVLGRVGEEGRSAMVARLIASALIAKTEAYRTWRRQRKKVEMLARHVRRQPRSALDAGAVAGVRRD